MPFGFNEDRSRFGLENIGLGTEINSGDDLDTLTTEGENYYFAGGATSPANAPESSTGAFDAGKPFTLEVVASAASGYVEQHLHCLAKTFTRSCDTSSGEWGNWTENLTPYDAYTKEEVQAILSSLFLTKSYSKAYACAANGTATIDFRQTAPSGYRAIAVQSHNTGSAHVVVVTQNVGSMVVRNVSGSAVNATAGCVILYAKTTI